MLALASNAAAQRRAPRTEADPALEEGARAVAEGRLPDAFAAYHRATTRAPADPRAWRALAEVAERLRVDDVALHAYRRYLELAPRADDHAEIAGRVHAIEQLARGARFVPEGDGESTRVVLVEAPPGSRHVLVDWQGRPLRVRRTSELLSLADWDGSLRSEIPNELMPFPTDDERGLGRRLGAP